jgi:hypothetical protein
VPFRSEFYRQTCDHGRVTETPPSAADLAKILEIFLADHPSAAVLEDGRVLFDMRAAHYALSADYGRCVLHLWSDERNLVRTIAAVDWGRQGAGKQVLRLHAKRFGQAKPQLLQLVPDRDHRTPTTRTASRARYLHLLERALARHFPDFNVEGVRNAMDLEHSFGPAYVRGSLVRGTKAWAVIGVGEDEAQPTIDGVLTLGILWLSHCRENQPVRRHYEGLKVIVPAGTAAVTRVRLAWLNPALAHWELYEMDERDEELIALDLGDHGNVDVHLVHAFNARATLERSRGSIEKVLALLPPPDRERVEVRPRSATETAFLLHGLEFARVATTVSRDSFVRTDEITFGAGANETPLTEDSQALFSELVARLFEGRKPGGSRQNPLYRLQPERWLESALRQELREIEPGIQTDFVYTQVPAFAASDRGMLDLLSVDRAGRLVVVELKADEDLHLPLQGLDYWLRVRKLQSEGAGIFAKHGYFRGVSLADLPPLLHFVAPALRIHPANQEVLRYLSPEVEWTLVALDEHWRERRRVVFRKRSSDGS